MNSKIETLHAVDLILIKPKCKIRYFQFDNQFCRRLGHSIIREHWCNNIEDSFHMYSANEFETIYHRILRV